MEFNFSAFFKHLKPTFNLRVMKTPLNAFAVSLWLIEPVLLRAFLEADLSTIIQMCFNFEIERKQSSFSPFLINEPVILAYFEEFHRGLSFQLPTQQTRSSTNGLKVSLILFSRNATLVLLTFNWTGKTSGKTQWISKLHNFRIAQSRPEKVSRYLLKSYVGSAKCRAVETFGVILHPYKDKECSNKRENVISICKWKSFNLQGVSMCS